MEDESIADHPNVALIKRLYAARALKKWDVFASYFAADAIWQYSGAAPVGRAYRDEPEIVGLFKNMNCVPTALSPRYLLASDEVAVACEVTAIEDRNSTGDPDYVHVYLIRDNRIVWAKSFQCIQDGLNDLWW